MSFLKPFYLFVAVSPRFEDEAKTQRNSMEANPGKFITSGSEGTGSEDAFGGSGDDGPAEISGKTSVVNSTENVIRSSPPRSVSAAYHRSPRSSSTHLNGYRASRAVLLSSICTGQYDDHIGLGTNSDTLAGGGLIPTTDARYVNADESPLISPNAHFNGSAPAQNAVDWSIVNTSQPPQALIVNNEETATKLKRVGRRGRLQCCRCRGIRGGKRKYCVPHPDYLDVCHPCVEDKLQHQCGGLKWPDGTSMTAEDRELLLRERVYTQWRGQTGLMSGTIRQPHGLSATHLPTRHQNKISQTHPDVSNYRNLGGSQQNIRRPTLRGLASSQFPNSTNVSNSGDLGALAGSLQTYSQVDAILRRRFPDAHEAIFAYATQEVLACTLRSLGNRNIPVRIPRPGENVIEGFLRRNAPPVVDSRSFEPTNIVPHGSGITGSESFENYAQLPHGMDEYSNNIPIVDNAFPNEYDAVNVPAPPQTSQSDFGMDMEYNYPPNDNFDANQDSPT